MFKSLNLKKSILRIVSIILISILTTTIVNVDASVVFPDALNTETAEFENNITTDSGIADPVTTEEAIADTDEGKIQAIEDSSTNSAMTTLPGITEEDSQREIETMATEVSGTAVAVDTFAELKSYLEDGTNGYTEFYLNADIIQTSGINVSTEKTDILLSGNYPATSGAVHTYTEMNSSSRDNTIKVSGNTNITIKDMTIDGYNYYGTVSSDDISANAGVYIEYDNVDYNGPQLCFAPYSTLHIKDSDIIIPAKQKGSSANNEISESSNVILEGKTNIKKQGDTGNSTFNIYNRTGSPGFTVLDGSDVSIESVSYFIYNTTQNVTFNIGESANLNCNIKGGITYSSQALGSINVNNNGFFKYIHDGTFGSLRTMIINGNLTVGNSATFDVRRTQASYSSTSQTRILLSMESSSSKIEFNNPERVILVNGLSTTDGLIRFSQGGTLNIQTTVMNQWSVLPAGFPSNINWSDPLSGWETDDLPSGQWNQSGFDVMNITATYSSSSPVASPTISGSYTPATSENTTQITSSNFLGTGSRMFTAGKSYLDFNSIAPGDNITGKAPAGSYIYAEYGSLLGWTSTDSNGNFSIRPTSSLAENTKITALNQFNFLRGHNSTTVITRTGALKFNDVPGTLGFNSGFTPVRNTIINRIDPDWTIKVEDTRNYSKTWQVYASIESPLSAEKNGTEFTLPDALIYKNGSNTDIFGAESILIRSGTTSDELTGGITPIFWNEDEGPLINISDGEYPLSNTNYTTTITWTLVDGPQ